MMKMRRMFIAVWFLLLYLDMGAICEDHNAGVDFIAELPTPGEFELFANGGWTGNWYIGYDQGWISQLPPVEVSGWNKAYIGAKIGRAKTAQQMEERVSSDSGNAGEHVGPYSIYIGVSASREIRPPGVILVKTDVIPLEGSQTMALENVGQSRWFWAQIPLSDLNTSGSNFIHLWSPDKELADATVSPILAGGLGSNERENSWLVKGGGDNSDIKVIKFFEPAIAIKLVGTDVPSPRVRIAGFESHPVDPAKYTVKAEVWGRMITSFGIQIDSGDGWKDYPSRIYDPPYNMSFTFKDLPKGKYKLRCLAVNWWESVGYSNPRDFVIEEKKSK